MVTVVADPRWSIRVALNQGVKDDLKLSIYSTYRNHNLDIESSTIHDAGDYTFVPEGYTQTLSAKVHIIGTSNNPEVLRFLLYLR